MISFDTFKQNWLGKRVGDDSLVVSREESEQTKYQCVSLVKQYLRECYELNPGAWGNAIHYWTRTAQELLSKFDQVSNNSASKGDIVVLWGLNGNSYGHIGIATGGLTGSLVEILEQNGSTGGGTGLGNDAIRTRWIERTRVAGLLRPRPVVVTPRPVINPVVGHAAVSPYSIKVTNKQPTSWWNLNGTTTDINTFQASAVLGINQDFRVGGYVNHVNGYTYAMSPEDYERYIHGDLSTFNGINMLDLNDKPAPKPPAAPLPVPTVEYYTLDTLVMYFGSPDNAKYHENALGTLDKGTYVVVKTVDNVKQVVKKNTDTDVHWINVNDNVVPVIETQVVDAPPVRDEPVDIPVVEVPTVVIPKKPMYDYVRYDRQPVWYITTNASEIEISDLEDPTVGKVPVPPKTRMAITMVGIKNGIEYGMPDKLLKMGWHHGLNMNMLELAPATNPFDWDNDGKVELEDATQFIETVPKRAYQLISEMKPVIHRITATDTAVKAKAHVTRFIDGFNNKRKVQ